MVILIRSAPGTADAARAMELAQELAAGGEALRICLISEAVRLALEIETGKWDIYCLEDDLAMRAIERARLPKGVTVVNYDGLAGALLDDGAKVIGSF